MTNVGDRILMLRVPERFVARVDAALNREGLYVLETEDMDCPSIKIDLSVIEGTPPADVPRLIAHGGPDFEELRLQGRLARVRA